MTPTPSPRAAEALKPLDGWRAVPGYDGYFVNSYGELMNRKTLRILKARERRGYSVYTIRVAGVIRSLFAHRAVLLAFVGECPYGYEASHINGHSLDNRLENLRWATKAENEADKVRHGTFLKGSRSMRTKLTPVDVREIRALAADGASFAWIARRFGIRWQSVQAIVRGKSWKHLP